MYHCVYMYLFTCSGKLSHAGVNAPLPVSNCIFASVVASLYLLLLLLKGNDVPVIQVHCYINYLSQFK